MSGWHHAPSHRLTQQGAYIVTAGTYQKKHLLYDAQRLDLVMNQLFACAEEFAWELQAWAILGNHYHFVASSPPDPSTLRRMISKLHTLTARTLNIWDQTPGRKVWYQYYDTRITYEASYLARLKYVHQNPARHGLVARAEDWKWCSAAWFDQKADSVLRRMFQNVSTDRVNVADEFAPASLQEETAADILYASSDGLDSARSSPRDNKAASSRRTP